MTDLSRNTTWSTTSGGGGETGNHYNYFRDYDPRIGRYVQSDPIGLQGGMNTYGYVGGSPLKYLDEQGLAKCDSLVCFSSGVNKRKLETQTSGFSPWELTNVHTDPLLRTGTQVDKKAGSILKGEEVGKCYFARCRTIAEQWEKYKTLACFDVCTEECGLAYSKWNTYDVGLGTFEVSRQDTEVQQVNAHGPILMLRCTKMLKGLN